MPSSWVEVANSALLKLGTGTISSFTQANKSERLTELRYPFARDCVLRLHNWNCAMWRVNSSNLSTPLPAFGYSYYHQLPTDCVRMVEVGPSGVDYKMEGKYIATDETSLELRYVQRVEDITQIEFLCAEAMATFLAWDLAPAFLNESASRDRLKEDFREALRQAKSVDGKEDPAGELEANLWIDSRMNGVGIDRSENWAR